MPFCWPLKVPERGNAITQRKTLEIQTTAKHVCLYLIRRTTQPGHYRFFLIPPKNPYSNQATQKNTCQIFVPQKNPESKISNPKKSFDHLRHLKSRVTPPPPPGDRTTFPNHQIRIPNCFDEKTLKSVLKIPRDGDSNQNDFARASHLFLYISLPSFLDIIYDVKLPNFTFYRERKQTTTNFYLSLFF